MIFTVLRSVGAGAWDVQHGKNTLRFVEEWPSTLISEGPGVDVRDEILEKTMKQISDTANAIASVNPRPGQVYRILDKPGVVRSTIGKEVVLLQRVDHVLIGKGWRHDAIPGIDAEWFTDQAFTDGVMRYVRDVSPEELARLQALPSEFVAAYEKIKRRPISAAVQALADTGAPPEILQILSDLEMRGMTTQSVVADYRQDMAEKGNKEEVQVADMMAVVIGARAETKGADMTSDETKKALAERTEELEAYKEALQRTQEGPSCRYGHLYAGPFNATDPETGKPSRRVLVAISGEVASVEADVKVLPTDKTKIGALLRLHARSGAVLAVESEQVEVGTMVIPVKAVPSDGVVEVEIGGMQRRLAKDPSLKVESGDRVRCDSGLAVVVANLGKDKHGFDIAAEQVCVSWDEVGGQKEAKAALIDAIETPVKHAEMFRRYGRAPSRGVLLYGPPGCGKTLMAKAAATAFAALQGGGPGGFLYIKGPEILNKWVGESERTIRGLFQRARDHYRETGKRAIMFIDEADAILGVRGSSRSSDVDKTIVPAFLAEMDGLDPGGPFVLLATNRQGSLDPAVVRDGRIDRKIEVNRPDRESAKAILELYLGRRPLLGEVGDLAARTAEEIYSGRHEISHVHHRVEGQEPVKHIFTLERIMNGAMLAGIVERATERAMRRDMDGCLHDPSGVCWADLEEAINDVVIAEKPMNHFDDMLAWAEELAIDLVEQHKETHGWGNKKPAQA